MDERNDVQPGAQQVPVDDQTIGRRYLIEWQYSPPDYFPTAVSEQLDECDLTIAQGVARVSIKAEAYENDQSARARLYRLLDARFKVQQFKTGRHYALNGDAVTESRPDGGRTAYLSFAASFGIGMTADLRITDVDGRVVSDGAESRRKQELAIAGARERNRIGLEKLDEQLAEAIRLYYQGAQRAEEKLVDSLFASNVASRDDPDNELVHLYELRDALARRFGNEATTLQALSLSKAEWSDFGRISNNEPIKQGRHRGKFAGELRAATEEELATARTFARKIFLAFLKYIG